MCFSSLELVLREYASCHSRIWPHRTAVFYEASCDGEALFFRIAVLLEFQVEPTVAMLFAGALARTK